MIPNNNNNNNNNLSLKFRKMEISEEEITSNSEEQVEPVLSLSTLLSNILGNDDFETDIFDQSSKSVGGHVDLENDFTVSPSTSYINSCNENPNYFQNYQPPTGTFLMDKDNYEWNTKGTSHPLEEFVDDGLIDAETKHPSWDLSYNINNNNHNNFNNSNVDMCSSVVPYTNSIVPAYNCDTFCEGNLSSPEGVVLPWSPSNTYDRHCTSYQPYQGLDSVRENLGGRFVTPPPSFEAKRLERVVSIKFENNDVPPRKNPILPIEFPEYPNRSSRFAGAGHLKSPSPCSRIWGLTVEQWQTHQTTFRYFPTNCDQPAYWHDYNSLEMPSSRESNSPPIPDPSGNQGTSEVASSPEGVAATSGGDEGGCCENESTLNKSPISKRIDGKRCGVCGDRALGYNFNAITCESCKAFFRRNALKNKEYRCPFNDECEVTAVTRRFCQRCRLRKCFEVGMKKEWIMTEEEKKKKRKKIMENRAKKVGEGDPTSSGTLAGPYLSEVNQLENLNTVSEQRTRIDAMADDIRSTLITSADNPLGLKPPALNQKPKAVVVGRVRVEENDIKVRKIGLESDVHSQKPSVIETYNAIETELPNSHICSSQIGVSSNLFDSQPQHHFHAVAPLPTSLTSTHLHHQSPSTHSSSDGLVAGLLRTQSRGSAESDLSSSSQASFCCLAENMNSETLVLVKKEIEDPPFGENKTVDESENSNSTETNNEGQFAFSVLGDSAAIFCQNNTTNLLPNSSSVKEETRKSFVFSIQEALNMIKPGCKDLSSDPKKSSGTTSVMDSILNTAISAEYSAFSLLMNSHSSELNQAENIKITELLEASKGLNSPLCEEPNYKDLPNPSLINVINLTEIAIRRLIKMAKKISAFKSFCQEDQIALLKGGCSEMMILRSVSAYDPDKEVWKIQQDHERFKNIKLKVLKAASGNVYEEHKRFILSFNSEWRQDARIMALLAAVALFTPERPNVLHPQAVRHEQSSYLYLLKRYMECKYGGCVGKTYYLKLLEIISNLHTLNDEHVKVFLEVNPQEVEPLLIEIFDLKQS